MTNRRRKRRSDSEPTVLTRSDKLTFTAWAAVALFVFLGWIFLIGIGRQAAFLDREIESWRRDYRVDDEQALRLRTIETEFHGNGNPFSRPVHSSHEVQAHRQALASVMNPEDGARFLAARQNHEQEAIARAR